MQGAQEREAGLPISPYMDSENRQPLPKMQIRCVSVSGIAIERLHR